MFKFLNWFARKKKRHFDKIALVTRQRTTGYSLFADDRPPTTLFYGDIEKFLVSPMAPLPDCPTVVAYDGKIRSTYYPPGQLPRGWSIEDHDSTSPSWLLERVS